MKKVGKMSLLVVSVFCMCLFAGCMKAPVVPPIGMIYSDVNAPLDVDVEKTMLGSKRGESSCINILGLVTVGDASIKKAAQEGNIQTVKHADYEYSNVFFFYQKYTTIVYGD